MSWLLGDKHYVFLSTIGEKTERITLTAHLQRSILIYNCELGFLVGHRIHVSIYIFLISGSESQCVQGSTQKTDIKQVLIPPPNLRTSAFYCRLSILAVHENQERSFKKKFQLQRVGRRWLTLDPLHQNLLGRRVCPGTGTGRDEYRYCGIWHW